MLFQCDLDSECQLFRGEYRYLLSSDDNFDMDLPLNSKRAKGGTLIMWKKELDIYITPLPTPSSSMLPILFTPTGLSPSVHVAIYLPTAGRDVDFAMELSYLDGLISDIYQKYPGISLFIRGDANVNLKNLRRSELLQNFCNRFNLEQKRLSHPTYHHFTGDGLSDSELDVLIHSCGASEVLMNIICKLSDPTILSHHDIILSKFTLEKTLTIPHQKIDTAPRVLNTRVKIRWSDEGINEYRAAISNNLGDLRKRWLQEGSNDTSSFSVMLQSTYAFLDNCARRTNYYIDLSNPPSQKSKRKPLNIVKSERYLRTCFKTLKRTPPSSYKYAHLTSKLKHLKQQHAHLLRQCKNGEFFSP